MRKTLLVGGVFLGLGMHQARAETANAAPQASTPSSTSTSSADAAVENDPNRLADITVTARKRSESVQKVPISVSVASGALLQEHQINDAFSLVTVSPSLQVQSANGQQGATNFSVRGVGTAVFGPQVESSVGVVIDDVAMGRPQFGAIQFFDIDRVEVLSGPQGMLFGKNASAGLVNIVTASPKLGKTEVLAQLQYGNMNSASAGNSVIAQGAINLPLSENSAVRITGFIKHNDGYAKNLTTSENLGMTEFGGRLKYLWQPSDRLAFTLAADYVHENGPAEGVLIRSYDAPGGFIAAADAKDGVVASRNNANVSGDGRTTNRIDVGGVSLKTELKLGGGYSLTNIAAYRKYTSSSNLDTDTTSVDLFNTNSNRWDYWQASDELRISSPSEDRFSYQAGLYYLHLNANMQATTAANLFGIAPALPAGLALLSGRLTPESKTDSAAAFFEGKFKVFDRLRLTGGARYTHDDLRYKIGVTNPSGLLPFYTVGNFSNSTTNDNVSYRLGADYDLNPSALVYVTYSRGYKSPTFDQLTAQKVGQEISKSVEIGLKSTFFDRRLRLNIALFDTKFDGFQAQAQSPAPATGYTTLNAGGLSSKGVELQFAILPFDGFSLSGGTTYNKTKYENFSGLPCYYGQVSGTSGANVCLADGSTNVSGNQLAGAPLWTTTATARYQRSISSEWKGFLQGDVYSRSTFNYSATNDPQTRVGASAVFGLSVGADSIDGRYGVSVFVRNLTDKRVPTGLGADPISVVYNKGGVTDAARGGNYFQQFGETSFRMIGVSFKYHM